MNLNKISAAWHAVSADTRHVTDTRNVIDTATDAANWGPTWNATDNAIRNAISAVTRPDIDIQNIISNGIGGILNELGY